MGSIDRRQTTPQLLNRLRMRQVALLLAIEETGTLRAAADRLGLTQPAATKMLKELEAALGLPLFERVGRGLQRNAAGERVTGYFRSVRGSMEALNRDVEDLRLGGAGKLAIGSIMAASPGRLTQALLQLKSEYPRLAIEVAVDTSDRLLAQLREGVLELVVGRMAPVPGVDCTFTAIEDEALSVIAANQHPLVRQRRVTFDQLLDWPWVLQPPGSPMRDLIEREFRRHRAELPAGLVETGSILTTMNLVRSSNFIGVIPASVASLNEEHKMLRVLAYKFMHALESYGTLVPRERPLSAPAARFLQLVHAPAAAGP